MERFVFFLVLLFCEQIIAHSGGHNHYSVIEEGDFASFILASSKGKLENSVTVKADGQCRFIQSNSIPNHESRGASGRNPNSMIEKSKTYRVTLDPQFSNTLTKSKPSSFGVALNGIPFRPSTAESWKNNPLWMEEAIRFDGRRLLGLDTNYGHVDRSGLYHYHGTPVDFLKQQQNKTRKQMILLGYAADGFPIYNSVGYQKALNSQSPLVKLESSYQLKRGMRPDDGPSGKYDGTYARDYEYLEGSGDLDECNGRFGVTPDYPKGIYHYVITDKFPFISRFWRGIPDKSFLQSSPSNTNSNARRNERENRQRPRHRKNDHHRPPRPKSDF